MAATVLVVDDERPIADTLCEILRISGYHCIAAYSGAEALKRADELKPALIISDVIMPGLNGIDLAKKVHVSDADCAVLLFSGNAATQDLLTIARSEGYAFYVLAKPVPPRELLRTVAKILESQHHANSSHQSPRDARSQRATAGACSAD